VRNRGRGLLLSAVTIFASFAYLVAPPTQLLSSAVAATASDFQPGNMISDDNFYNAMAMSESDIQAFLAVKGASCSGSECLKSYAVDTTSRAADPMCTAYRGAAAEPASRIIAKVAQACGISPQVLIVTLEKESSIVDTTTPSESRYTVSMGFGCPDTSSCDTNYYGFFNQMYSAARQLKRYSNPVGTSNYFTWYPVGQTTALRYSPTASCGSGNVYIANEATAALYYYTPYQPNATALNNLYGVGDGCSAYGNRNFWTFYSDWFGSPTGTPFGNVDSLVAQWGSVHVTGWLRGPTPDVTEYVWVNVDGVGAAYLANRSLAWFPANFPGYSANHGFDLVVPTTPGSHHVCVYRASTGTTLQCSIVTAPRSVGSLDSVSAVPGGARVTGWSVDAASVGVSNISINVDGTSKPYQTNTYANWLPVAFPGASPNQAYDISVQVSPGAHTVCVSGPEFLLGCRQIVNAHGAGAFDSATSLPGSAKVTGWYVDFSGGDRSYVWMSLDGVGGPRVTNTTLNWLPVYLPGFSANNGYSYTLPLRAGAHSICMYGANSGASLGCKSVSIPYSSAGNVDQVTGGQGTISLSGWMADLTTSAPGYIWVNVNGTGGAYLANQPLGWFDVLYPGEGANHGFNITVPKPAGTYQVCVYGSTEALALGCQTATVR
jgi:hypothetical protein